MLDSFCSLTKHINRGNRRNTQNDRLYAHLLTKKKNVATRQNACTHKVQSLTAASVGSHNVLDITPVDHVRGDEQ